jgi:xylulokinase
MGVMLSAAGALKWWSESIFNNKDYETYFNKLMETPIEDSLFFLPYLTGERSPINDPNAKGVFFGLGLQHRKEHMDRAVIEGITFALKDSYRLIEDLGVDINTIRITGGGAKSPIWAQMIADIMNVETVTLKAEEGPALGAAILAMVGCEAYDNVEEACSAIIKLKEAYQPNHENAMLYINKYESFKKIYPKVKDLF